MAAWHLSINGPISMSDVPELLSSPNNPKEFISLLKPFSDASIASFPKIKGAPVMRLQHKKNRTVIGLYPLANMEWSPENNSCGKKTIT